KSALWRLDETDSEACRPDVLLQSRLQGGKHLARRKGRIANVEIGNCAAALVQGIHYYRDIGDSPSVPGLMRPVIGQYKVSDVVFTAAFDVNATKVGRDLADA